MLLPISFISVAYQIFTILIGRAVTLLEITTQLASNVGHGFSSSPLASYTQVLVVLTGRKEIVIFETTLQMNGAFIVLIIVKIISSVT